VFRGHIAATDDVSARAMAVGTWDPELYIQDCAMKSAAAFDAE
jgi:hypothetical protein